MKKLKQQKWVPESVSEKKLKHRMEWTEKSVTQAQQKEIKELKKDLRVTRMGLSTANTIIIAARSERDAAVGALRAAKVREVEHEEKLAEVIQMRDAAEQGIEHLRDKCHQLQRDKELEKDARIGAEKEVERLRATLVAMEGHAIRAEERAARLERIIGSIVKGL